MGTLQTEPLLVDDLLDFSCGYIGGLCEEGDDCAPSVCGQEHDYSSVQVAAVSTSSLARSSSDSMQETAELLYSPPEDLADELEWLSTFVEESYRGEDHSMPLVSSEQWFSKSGGSRKEGWCGENNSWRMTSWLRMDKSGVFCQILDMGSNPLIETRPGEPARLINGRWDKRGRSKRSSRSSGRVWSLQTVICHKRPQEEEDEEEEEEEAEEEHSQTSSLDYESFCECGTEEQPSSRKKAKKERCGNEEGRRCSHCQVEKTPQWRAGPLGPKTLCNACGVRFKSGRLLPEYRPAASPTFITQLHSNSHKKVLEMRSSKLAAPTPLPQQERHAHLHNQPLQQDQEELSSSTCSQESISSLQQY